MLEMDNVSAYRKELKDKILKVAMQEFIHKGIKSVKMDDIAHFLAISKRTLYELFVNKETLLLACIKNQQNDFEEHMSNFYNDHQHNVIEVIVEVQRLEVQKSYGVNPLFFSDLHKYTKVLDYLQQKHDERNCFAKDFFKEGIKQGYFRSDINYQLALKVCQDSMQNVMESQLYKTYPLVDIYNSFIGVFIRGLCTLKGLEILDKREIK